MDSLLYLNHMLQSHKLDDMCVIFVVTTKLGYNHLRIG